MSLLNKILPKKEEQEYFLTVAVEENRIIATVALISGNEVNIIGTGESEFDETSEEIEAADIAISEAEKKIGSNVLVEKVIFGLPLSLLSGDNIKPEHLARLKKITKTLALTPCGFIEYPQALSFYLQTKEESPPTLLLISVGKDLITFSHIRVSKIEKNVIVEKSDSILSDFEKALLEFSSSEILPSRIIFYDESGESNLEKLSEELLKFPWHKHSTFLHTPKVETLQKEALTFALVEAAAKSLAHELQFEEKDKKEPVSEEIKEETSEPTFGFIKGKDIKEEKVVEEEISPPKKEMLITEEVEEPKGFVEEKKPSMITNLPKINFSFPEVNFNKMPLIIFGIIAILIFILTLFLFFYYPKTTVNLIVYPGSTTSNVEVLFTTNEDTAKSGKNNILASTISSEATGNKSSSTTGKTKIGEKASGTVTVYNKTLASKIFTKGTVLTADTLRFTLDDDVTIASASDTGEGLTFGKKETKITATDIGPEGNLAAGTNFYFKDFDKSLYYAKNTEKLTGGTSRDITSVSKEDQEELLSSVTDELTTTAKQEMIQKLTAGDRLLDTSLTTTVSSKKFDKNVGDETKELSLNLTIKVGGLVYKEKDLLNLASEESTKIPDGFTKASEKTTIKISEAKIDKKGDVLGKATITYYFFPQIDIDKIRIDITGKTFNEVDKYLSIIKEIGGVEIITDPKIPFVNSRLPLRKENIKIKLVSS